MFKDQEVQPHGLLKRSQRSVAGRGVASPVREPTGRDGGEVAISERYEWV